MPKCLSVLVTGATGNQGGAVARMLLGRGHRVRGLTRKPESPAATKLKALGAEIFAGDMEDRGSLAKAAWGMDAIFFVSTPFDSGGPATEVRQGINVADAAQYCRIKHLFTARYRRQTRIPESRTSKVRRISNAISSRSASPGQSSAQQCSWRTSWDLISSRSCWKADLPSRCHPPAGFN